MEKLVKNKAKNGSRMKRTYSDINSASDSSVITTVQRKRRRRSLIDSPNTSPSLSPCDVDHKSNNEHQLSSLTLTSPDESIQTTWACSMCTFENNESMQKCQMCDTKRDHKSDKISKLKHESPKRRRKGRLKKELSVVDLTTNESTKTYKKHRKKTKKCTNSKQSKTSNVSNISGTRSRNKYFEKLLKQKSKKTVKKRKISRTESIQSFHTDIEESVPKIIKKPKRKCDKMIMSDEDDSDCQIIPSKIKQKISPKNGASMQYLKTLHTEQWIDKYAPHKIEDLYLHKKKLSEMDNWFHSTFKALENATNESYKYVKSVLFVIGQSGIGKTSTIKCLCTKYNAKLLCYPNIDSNVKTFASTIWDNDSTHYTSFKNDMFRMRQNIQIQNESQMKQFEGFLNRCKRFKALNLSNNAFSVNQRQVILVRELPYIGKAEYLSKFQSIVEKLCNSTRTIVIFEITTEFEGTRDEMYHFGASIKSHFRVSIIRFNGINKTLMKKCLNDIINKEKLNLHISNIKELVNDIVENEGGDLRNAIQTLQMRLVELSHSGCSEKKMQNKGGKKRKQQRKNGKKMKKKNASSMISSNVGGRETTLSLFHSLGKVLYAKKEMECEECIERSDLDCILFNDLLFENFGDFFVNNLHFQLKNNQQQKFDEFGFEIMQKSESDIAFEKYCDTLNYFGDADICSAFYQNLRYHDTSTDLRSTTNDIQFGTQLYPALYCASIGCRGYLMAHSKPPKIKGRGMKQLRGSTEKKVTNLKNQLCERFSHSLIPKHGCLSDINEHGLSDDMLGLLRSFIGHPTSMHVDIFPIMFNMTRDSLERVCKMDGVCTSLIQISNAYSGRYEFRQFRASRFDYLQQSASSMPNHRKCKERNGKNEVDGGVIDEIEEF